MSKINQIQRALQEIDGGKFQKLSDLYLTKKGYDHINSIGTAIGSDKVRKGTPDSFTRNQNGKFIFAEHTTTQSDLVKKLHGDLKKCLDIDKTGVPLDEIEEIIFCHNSSLTVEEERQLYTTEKEHGIKIRILGLSAISFDLYQKHPSLAHDFLGISIDTGQILEPEEFVQKVSKNQISTPLDTDFFGRKEELADILEKLLTSNLVIISGPAGVGKSRLAIKAIEDFKKNSPDYQLRVIHNKGIDLFQDIKSYFSESGNFLLLVDDANRVTQFDYITDLIQNQRADQNIKVVATVRDYAKDKVLQSAKPLSLVSQTEIKPLTDEEIRKLISNQYDINNSLYLERISDIAGGNPRLAIMAAKITLQKKTLQSIRDVSALYDEYFSSISNDMKNLEDSNILKVAGVISFFRHVDRSNDQITEAIHTVFGITLEDFWVAVEYLHAVEIVDIYEKEVVKVSDQVFATYLFYICFFKEKKYDFSELLKHFFPSQAGRIRDALYPCLNSFDYDAITTRIKSHIKTRWQEISNVGDTKSLREFINTFWFLIQPEVLVYLRNEISRMKAETIDIEDIDFKQNNISFGSHPAFKILALFQQASDEPTYSIALNLACEYVEKRPSSGPQFVKLMVDEFGFNRHSHSNDYLLQTKLVEHLWNKTKQSNSKLLPRLFLEVASNFLRTDFDSHEGGKRAVTIYKFRLLEIEKVFKLREIIWKGIFFLYKNKDYKAWVIELLKNYSAQRYYLSQDKIVEDDAKHFLPFFENQFSPTVFSECLIVQSYSKLLLEKQIDHDKKLTQKFFSPEYELYSLLSLECGDTEVDNYSDFQTFRTQKLTDYSRNFDFSDYKEFVNSSLTIFIELRGSRDNYQIINSIADFLIILSSRNASLYEEVIRYYLALGNPLEFIQGGDLCNKLIDACGAEKALSILTTSEYKYKTQWLFSYYEALKFSDLTPETVDVLLSLYSTADAQEIPRHFDYLVKYFEIDKSIIQKILRVIVDKIQEVPAYGACLDMLFNYHTEINKQIFEYIQDLSLIKRAYLIHCQHDQHPDYNGNTLGRILAKDNNFILELVSYVYGKDCWFSRYSDNRDYDFLWEHENCEAILNIAIKEILRIESNNRAITGGFLSCLFCIRDQKDCSSYIKARQDEFLTHLIRTDANSNELMQLIFSVISEFQVDRRVKLIKIFLDENIAFYDFRNLHLEPFYGGGSGSAVSHYQEKVDFWEQVLSLCDSIDYLEHRLLCQGQVDGYRRQVEQEKKSDFIDEF